MGTGDAEWVKDTFCSYCGRRFEELERWPRACDNCERLTYRNPVPVAVLLVPVDDGLVFVRRTIHPGMGKLALPGGYINHGERWQEAAVREFFEETQVMLDPDNVREFRVRSTPDGTVLIFGLSPRQPRHRFEVFEPNAEASELVIARNVEDIAFPLHAEVVNAYLFSHPIET